MRYLCQFIDRVTYEVVSGMIFPANEQDLLEQMGWRYSPDDEDRDWDWSHIYFECLLSKGRYECFVAHTLKELQGLMVLAIGKSEMKRRRGVIVDYLATNPTNRSSRSGLKHVGMALIGVAVLRSIQLGHEGRIWLESLPSRAGFYQGLGMTKRSRFSHAENAIYFLEKSAAKELLEEIENGRYYWREASDWFGKSREIRDRWRSRRKKCWQALGTTDCSL